MLKRQLIQFKKNMKKSKTYIWSKKNLDNDDDELIKLTLASLTIYQIKKILLHFVI